MIKKIKYWNLTVSTSAWLCSSLDNARGVAMQSKDSSDDVVTINPWYSGYVIWSHTVTNVRRQALLWNPRYFGHTSRQVHLPSRHQSVTSHDCCIMWCLKLSLGDSLAQVWMWRHCLGLSQGSYMTSCKSQIGITWLFKIYVIETTQVDWNLKVDVSRAQGPDIMSWECGKALALHICVGRKLRQVSACFLKKVWQAHWSIALAMLQFSFEIADLLS